MPEAADRSLTGLRVVVTRPREQAEHLVRLIEACGGEAIRFPVIEIVDPEDRSALPSAIERLDRYALAIFVSPNAVRRAMDVINARGGWRATLRAACVGRGSAEALKHYGIEAIAPRTRFDSEALLELPELQDVAGQRVVVFRGAGGRELLGETLRARGAQVDFIECYRRVRPAVDAEPLRRRGARGEIDLITVTSGDGLRHLVEMVGPQGRDWLFAAPLVVVSARMAEIARELGFVRPARVAAQAADSAILEAIRAWRQEQKTL